MIMNVVFCVLQMCHSLITLSLQYQNAMLHCLGLCCNHIILMYFGCVANSRNITFSNTSLNKLLHTLVNIYGISCCEQMLFLRLINIFLILFSTFHAPSIFCKLFITIPTRSNFLNKNILQNLNIVLITNGISFNIFKVFS